VCGHDHLAALAANLVEERDQAEARPERQGRFGFVHEVDADVGEPLTQDGKERLAVRAGLEPFATPGSSLRRSASMSAR
jgi:hypothetical protein